MNNIIVCKKLPDFKPGILFDLLMKSYEKLISEGGLSNPQKFISKWRRFDETAFNNEKIGKCTVSDYKVTQADDCLVVTNMLAVEETIDGKRLPAKSFARLSVWKQNQGTWQMITIANLRAL